VDATDLGKRIANARRLKGLTQAELGDAVGVSKGSVRNWETGGKTPRDALPRLEQVLEVDLGSGGYVGPDREDADGVLLDLPDEALEGLTEAERDEVITAARLAALQRAREIRGR
jgi:transcriptional regulator with XRE-family HTH domain